MATCASLSVGSFTIRQNEILPGQGLASPQGQGPEGVTEASLLFLAGVTITKLFTQEPLKPTACLAQCET